MNLTKLLSRISNIPNCPSSVSKAVAITYDPKTSSVADIEDILRSLNGSGLRHVDFSIKQDSLFIDLMFLTMDDKLGISINSNWNSISQPIQLLENIFPSAKIVVTLFRDGFNTFSSLQTILPRLVSLNDKIITSGSLSLSLDPMSFTKILSYAV